MFDSIQIVEIVIADAIGLLVLFIAAFGNMYKVKAKTVEGIALFVIIIILSISLIFEVLVSYLDASSGFVEPNAITRIINIVGNTILFFNNVVMAACWSIYIIAHLNGYLSRSRFVIMTSIIVAYFVAIVVNIFVPFIFRITPEGVYERINLGYLINVGLAMALFFIDPIINYFLTKRRSGSLKYFPIWLFYIPAFAGILFQVLNYGTCTLYVGLSIGVLGIILASQNDMIFRDKLTGLYNRFFLDRIKEKITRKRKDTIYTAMMIDINGFKKINDEFGHSVGDEALVTTASLLKEAVGTFGTIIRYAGDEFVVVINANSDLMIKGRIDDINRVFETFNKKNIAPYKLSISLGYAKADLKKTSIDELMNEIDKKMYEDKLRFYNENPEFKRNE